MLKSVQSGDQEPLHAFDVTHVCAVHERFGQSSGPVHCQRPLLDGWRRRVPPTGKGVSSVAFAFGVSQKCSVVGLTPGFEKRFQDVRL